jgi:hypothetical protein
VQPGGNHGTRDLLESEEYMDWLETPIGLIETIGLENYLTEQMGNDEDEEDWTLSTRSRRARWQQVQPSPAPVCRRTSSTLRSPRVVTAWTTISSVTLRQWQI